MVLDAVADERKKRVGINLGYSKNWGLTKMV